MWSICIMKVFVMPFLMILVLGFLSDFAIFSTYMLGLIVFQSLMAGITPISITSSRRVHKCA